PQSRSALLILLIMMPSSSAATPSIPRWLLDLVRCPRCAGLVSLDGERLLCRSCGAAAPIRDGVPTFVEAAADPVSRRTQSSFGYEWTHFSDWQPSGAANFGDYFSDFDLRT